MPWTHYVTRRSHQTQKHKFGVTCPGAPFEQIALGPPEHENKFVTFRALDHQNALRDPQIALDAKTQVQRNVSRHTFCGMRTGST
jgi:hypothetical protein